MPICAATYGETKLRGNTWELPLQARAYENGVYVVAVNRCGMEQGRNHIGRSMIVDPVGADIVALASSDTPELLVATVDLDNIAAAQTSLPWWRELTGYHLFVFIVVLPFLIGCPPGGSLFTVQP